MTRLVASVFTSVDGVVDADSDWQYPFFDDELFAWVTSAWSGASAVLIGRRSFEGYERLRSEAPDSPVLEFLDDMPTSVVSRTMPGPPREGVEVFGDNVEARIRALVAAVDGDVLLMGSPALLRWLVEHALVDELSIMVLPVVVGAGPRLFDGTTQLRAQLTLLRSRSLRSGAVELVYAVGRHEAGQL